MKTHSDQNKSTSSRANDTKPFFSGKNGDKDSFFNPIERSLQSSPFFMVQTKPSEKDEINQKESLNEEKDSEKQNESQTTTPGDPPPNSEVPPGYVHFEFRKTHYGKFRYIKRHLKELSRYQVDESTFDTERSEREALFGKVEPIIRQNKLPNNPNATYYFDTSKIYIYPLTEEEKRIENQRIGTTTYEIPAESENSQEERSHQTEHTESAATSQDTVPNITEEEPSSSLTEERKTTSIDDAKRTLSTEHQESLTGGPPRTSTSPYWKHEWQLDRFGREALFVWEVGGTRRYAKPGPGFAYIQKMTALTPGDPGYDPRFEKFKKRPQIGEKPNPELNWWLKKTPGWDDPNHTDDGTADFEDLGEFKDAPHNRKGTGFYYMEYIFDPSIYEKLEAQKRDRKNKQYIGNVTNYKGYVKAENGIILHDTPTPFDETYQENRKPENKSNHLIDHNSPLTIIAEGNEQNEGWVMVKTPEGEIGWIERRYISKEPDTQTEDIFPSYTIKEGDNLESLINSYYKDYPFATGNDRRTVALAIYLYNKDKPGSGVYRNHSKYKEAGSWKDTLDPWMQETRANYESVELYAGGKVLLPPPQYIEKMRQQGEIEKRPDFVNAAIEGGRVIQGFIAGVGIGFWEALEGAVEDLYDLVMDIFTGEIFNQIAQMFDMIMESGIDGLWEMLGDSITNSYEEVVAAWNNPNPYERGEYFGKIVGNLLFEAVLALISAGAANVIKNSSRVNKIMKLFPDLSKKIDKPKYKNKYDDIDRPGDKDVDLDKDKNKHDDYDKDKDKDKDKDSDNQAYLKAKLYVEAQDAIIPSPNVEIVLSHINKTPGMKLSGGKKYKAERNGKGEGHFRIYYNPTLKKDYSEGKNNKKEVIEEYSTYEQARNRMIELTGNIEPSTPVIGRLEKSKGFKKIVGRQSSDGKIRWRVDYDPDKGPHINVEDFSKGKGELAQKTALLFEGDESTFEKILKTLNK